mgnify:CR=1 FL=1
MAERVVRLDGGQRDPRSLDDHLGNVPIGTRVALLLSVTGGDGGETFRAQRASEQKDPHHGGRMTDETAPRPAGGGEAPPLDAVDPVLNVVALANGMDLHRDRFDPPDRVLAWFRNGLERLIHLRPAAGGTITEASAEDRKAWADAMPNIAAEWAKGLDDKGQPGTDMLNAYLGKLEASGFTGARDWTADLTN